MKRNLCLLLLIASLLSLPTVLSVGATRGNTGTNTNGEWTLNQVTYNLINLWAGEQLDSLGWSLSTDQIHSKALNYNDGRVGLGAEFGVVIQADGNEDDIGTKEYGGGASFPITLSDADIQKAQNGELSISARSLNWFQRSSHHYISLRLYFYNKDGAEIGNKVEKFEKYYVGQENRWLSIDSYPVPAGTTSIRMWVSNWGSLSGRPSIGAIQCYLYDSTAPTFKSAALNPLDIVDTANRVCIAGDTIEYRLKFSEKVTVTDRGTASLTRNGAHWKNADSAAVDGDTVIYTFRLPDAAESGVLALGAVNSLTVRDEAGNSFTYSGTPSAGTIRYLRKMAVLRNLSKISIPDFKRTAEYGTDYTATLAAASGYALPAAIEVKVGDHALAADTDYTYNSVNGSLRINGFKINDDITIAAVGVPRQYTVTLEGNGATTVGTAAVTATFDADMPAATMPQRVGYTFLGYFDALQGGVQYYKADGSSVRAYDKPDASVLYAHWQANEYTVIYNENKPSAASSTVIGIMANSRFVYDGGGTLRRNSFVLQGWIFKGWAYSADGSAAFVDAASVSNLTPSGSITLYAVWEAAQYTVTLNAAGGSGSAVLPVTYDAPLSGISVPAKLGHVFLGYFDEVEGGVQYCHDDGNSAKNWDKISDATLYAHWKPITYHIHFYSMGRYAGEKPGVTYGSLTLPSAEALGLSRANYNFVGWNLFDEQSWGMYAADTDYSIGIATEQDELVYLYAAWLEKDKFQITYDANGGEGAPSPIILHEDETAALSDMVPVRYGYTFRGWALAGDSTTPDYQPLGSFTMGNMPITLYAVWEKNPVLSYDANGGVFSYYVAEIYPQRGSSVTLTQAVPTKDGYNFVGWASTSDATEAEALSGGDYVMPTDDTVLYAVWAAKIYTVSQAAAAGYTISDLTCESADGMHIAGGLPDYTCPHGSTVSFTVNGEDPKVYVNGIRLYPTDGRYRCVITQDSVIAVMDGNAFSVIYNANGGSGAPVDIVGYAPDASAAVKTGTPVREGYTFLGWAVSPSASAPEYAAGDPIEMTADVTLYALWKPVSYTVELDANGGVGGSLTLSAAYDEITTLPANPFSKAGCRFLGWTTDIDYGMMYADGASIKNLTKTQDAAITLYAVWETAKTVIYLDADGGFGGSTTVSAVYNSFLTAESMRAPQRYGYAFGGYFTQEDGRGESLFDKDMKLVGRYASTPWDKADVSIVYYAYWIPNSYEIVYIRGEEQIGEPQAAQFGTAFTLRAAEEMGITAPDGHHFAGWTLAAGSDVVWYTDGQTITSGLSSENGGVVYLYAVIAENGFVTLNFDANGGSGAPQNTTVRVQSDGTAIIEICADVPTKDGCTFAGWNTQSDGEGAAYQSGDSISVTKNTTLYAVWTRLGEYAVTYYKNTTADVYGLPMPQIKTEGVPLSISRTIPYCDGYAFLGWATTADGEVAYAAGADCRYDGDAALSLYAVWKMKTYSVALPVSGEGYAVSDGGSVKTVAHNGSISFTVTLREGYSAERMVVAANGVSVGFDEIRGDAYVYTLKNIVNDTTVTVSGISRTCYTVILNNGVGYTVSPQMQTVGYGEDLVFTVTAESGYQTEEPRVYENGVRLNGVKSDNTYTYTVSNVKRQPVLSIVLTQTPQYDIIFVSNDSVYAISPVADGDRLARPAEPERTGYRFIGWYSDKTLTALYDFDTTVTSAFVLYAKWKSNEYVVSYDANVAGSVVRVPEDQIKQHGEALTLSGDIPVRTGYRFVGWNTAADGSGTSYAASATFMVNADAVLYAQWETLTYTVTFIVDGAVYSTANAAYDTLLSEIVAPSKDGFAFVGWKNGGEMWSFERDHVTSSLTLTAVFSGASYTVTPPSDGIGYTVAYTDDTTVIYGGSFLFDISVNTGYNAETLRVFANGRLILPTDTEGAYRYAVNSIVSDCVITVEEPEKNIYTVEYRVGGDLYRSSSVAHGAALSRPLTPSKLGHTLLGWKNGDEMWDFESDLVTCDLTLEAQWRVDQYIVTLPESTEVYTVASSDPSTIPFGGSYTFTVTVADGYAADDLDVFANGRMLEPQSANDGVYTYTLTDIHEALTVTIRGGGLNTYSVVYKSGTTEYAGNMPEGTIKIHGRAVSIASEIPTRRGYEFLGWAETQGSDAATYLPNDSYETDGDVILYAVWSACSYNVVYEENGGSAVADAQYVYAAGLTLPTADEITRDGYVFSGWYANERLEGVSVTEITAEDVGDKTFYARWEPAAVTPNGYEGVYDGQTHSISFSLTVSEQIQNCQWYYKAADSEDFVAVPSADGMTLSVRDVADSGIYYCFIEVLRDEYVTRFATDECTVNIIAKEVTVTAADGTKTYDATPLTAAEYIASGLADPSHTLEVVFDASSTITDCGSCENRIQAVTVRDGDGKNVTSNYAITTEHGTLTVEPAALTLSGRTFTSRKDRELTAHSLYTISGLLHNENLAANVEGISIHNAEGEVISDLTAMVGTIGTYTIELTYSGFSGAGSENYVGSGVAVAQVTISKSSAGGVGGGSGTGGAAETYTVRFDSNGGSSVASQSVKANSRAAEPTAPEKEGYGFDGWYRDSALTEKFDFAARITQSITLYAKWTADATDEERPAADPSVTGVADLLETARHGAYMRGYADGTFKPERNMTRAEAAQLFYNLLLHKEGTGSSTFDDVRADAWYYDAVTLLADMGIIKGRGNGLFDPDGEITRAEFTAIAMRFVKIEVKGTAIFTDVPATHWAAESIAAAAALGWISGNGDGTFRPNAFIDRASVTRLVNRMLARTAYLDAHADSVMPFSDVSASTWYYAEVAEAANAHAYEKTDGVERWK